MSDQSDFLQTAWDDPKAAHAIHVDKERGFMIIPDAKPVVPVGHVMVVAREQSMEELSDERWAQLTVVARIVSEQLTRMYQPERKTGFCVWGNQARTPHLHVFPRNTKEDGKAFFDENRVFATDEQLAETQQKLASVHWAEIFRERLQVGIVQGSGPGKTVFQSSS